MKFTSVTDAVDGQGQHMTSISNDGGHVRGGGGGGGTRPVYQPDMQCYIGLLVVMANAAGAQPT